MGLPCGEISGLEVIGIKPPPATGISSPVKKADVSIYQIHGTAGQEDFQKLKDNKSPRSSIFRPHPGSAADTFPPIQTRPETSVT
jgi:hypothetical protein